MLGMVRIRRPCLHWVIRVDFAASMTCPVREQDRRQQTTSRAVIPGCQRETNGQHRPIAEHDARRTARLPAQTIWCLWISGSARTSLRHFSAEGSCSPSDAQENANKGYALARTAWPTKAFPNDHIAPGTRSLSAITLSNECAHDVIAIRVGNDESRQKFDRVTCMTGDLAENFVFLEQRHCDELTE